MDDKEGSPDEERDWVQRMADLEDKHDGFPGFPGFPRFSGRLLVPCPVCGLATRRLMEHAMSQEDPAHVIYSVLES